MGGFIRRDSRLDRTCRPSILPEEFAADTERVRRFEQESRSVAALNHPNIVAIYDVGAQDGVRWECHRIPGREETLRERLQEASLSVNKAVDDYGLQIARGLAAAHERHYRSRSEAGECFYHARWPRSASRLRPARAPAVSDSDSVLVETAPGTGDGHSRVHVAGQVRGEVVDHRTDIFSFGAVLDEMLDGSGAFTGDTSLSKG